MNLFFAKLYHLKLKLIGDKEMESEGKIIPCIECGTPFKSYCSYGSIGFVYHTHCRTCELLKQGGLL